MALSLDQVEHLLHVARDASLGSTFVERMDAIALHVLRVVPGASVHAFTFNARSVVGRSPQGGTVLAPPGKRDYVDQVARGKIFAKDFDVEAAELYATQAHLFDRWVCSHFFEPRVPHRLSDCFSPRDLRRGKDPYTGDFLPRAKIGRSVGLHYPLTEDLWLTFSVNRPPGARDFTDTEVGVVKLIGADLAHAALGSILVEEGARAWREPDASLRSGILIFGPRGVLMHADPAALALLRRIEADGRDPFPGLASAARCLARGEPGDLSSARRVYPLRGGGWLRAGFSRLTHAANADQVVVLLEVLAPGTHEHFEAEATHARFTPREKEVAALAIRGLGIREMARDLGISPITVKFHLGRCYAKTGVAGQAELTAHLLGVGGAGRRARSSR